MTDILIIQAHPDHTRSFCSALAAAYKEGAASAHVSVEVLNLAALKFDPVLHRGYAEVQELESDLMTAKDLIERAKHVVWVFPMWWVSTPALLKGFIDRLFLPGWAFSFEEGQSIPKKLLKGRSARVLVTMDSPSWWYTLMSRRALKASFESGTLGFSGFSPISRTLFHSIQASTPERRSTMLGQARRAGELDALKLSKTKALARA